MEGIHQRHFIQGNFNPVCYLGRGSFCKVWNVKSNKTNEHRAVKILDSRHASIEPTLAPLAPSPSDQSEPVDEAPRFGRLETQFNFALNLDSQPVHVKTISAEALVVASNTKRDAEDDRTLEQSSEFKVLHEYYVKTELRAADILMNASHPNLIKVFDVIQTNTHIYIYMENCESGTMYDYLKTQNKRGRPLRGWRVRKWTRQIADALNYMHTTLFMAHRDLKLDNIGLDGELNCKILDFGFSCSIREERKVSSFGMLYRPAASTAQTFVKKYHNSLCGTKLYMAPEVMAVINRAKKYEASRADMYSLGVCLFLLLTGHYPCVQNLQQNIRYETYKTKYVYSAISVDAFDLLHNLLTPFPTQRFTAQDVLDHPFTALPGVY